MLQYNGERAGWDREVEGMVSAGAAGGVQLGESPRQLVERGIVVERTLNEPEALGKGVPHLFAERSSSMIAYRVVHDLLEILVLPLTASEADQGETGG